MFCEEKFDFPVRKESVNGNKKAWNYVGNIDELLTNFDVGVLRKLKGLKDPILNRK